MRVFLASVLSVSSPFGLSMYHQLQLIETLLLPGIFLVVNGRNFVSPTLCLPGLANIFSTSTSPLRLTDASLRVSFEHYMFRCTVAIEGFSLSRRTLSYNCYEALVSIQLVSSRYFRHYFRRNGLILWLFSFDRIHFLSRK